ncbi:hypothetical protein [Paraburkholderia caledonica]|uniref:hypothetical protein n=1 Tax=Paraburkholderia caledonica TaxID=134536 RepID=UPI00037635AB|nr:hypothetical protein [Paraburkholderia caledonica]
MDRAPSVIGKLDKAVNTLVHRATLIRREYWRAEVQRLRGRTDITVPDRRRLYALHHLLGDAPAEDCIRGS